MGFVITAIILTAVVLAEQTLASPCAVPSLLKGNLLELTYAAGDIKRPIAAQSSFIYDANTKRIYTHTTKDGGKSFQAYKFYDISRQYIIASDGSCRVKPLNENFPVLTIPNPTDTVSLQNGGVKMYSGSAGIRQFVISTKGNCLPTSWTEFLPLGPRFLVKQRVYSDVSENVDLSQVRLPAKCTVGRFITPW